MYSRGHTSHHASVAARPEVRNGPRSGRLNWSGKCLRPLSTKIKYDVIRPSVRAHVIPKPWRNHVYHFKDMKFLSFVICVTWCKVSIKLIKLYRVDMFHLPRLLSLSSSLQRERNIRNQERQCCNLKTNLCKLQRCLDYCSSSRS